jgi:hypothetical protein
MSNIANTSYSEMPGEARDRLFRKISPIMDEMSKSELMYTMYILAYIVKFMEEEGDGITVRTIDSVLRNVCENMRLLHYYGGDCSGSVTSTTACSGTDTCADAGADASEGA